MAAKPHDAPLRIFIVVTDTEDCDIYLSAFSSRELADAEVARLLGGWPHSVLRVREEVLDVPHPHDNAWEQYCLGRKP